MQQPSLGWTTSAKLRKLGDTSYEKAIKDGDTVVLVIEKEIVIRVINNEVYFDTPEIFRPKLPGEREAGKKAKQDLINLLTKEVKERSTEYVPVGDNLYKQKVAYTTKRVPRDIVVYIPTDGNNKLQDITQLSRFGGVIFADGVDITDEMIKLGNMKKDSYETV